MFHSPLAHIWIGMPRRRRYEPRADQPWTAAEDRKLMRAVGRMLNRSVEPWQAKPMIDWSKLARRHGRSGQALRARVSLLRAAARLAHGIENVTI